MSESIDDIKRSHNLGFFALIDIYVNQGKFKGWITYSAIATTLIALLMIKYCAQTSPYDVLQKIVENIISLIPNILGFNLGGYVLLMGLNASKLLNELIEKTEASPKYSTFQVMNSVFATSVFIQSITLAVAYFTYWFMYLSSNIILDIAIAKAINYFWITIVMFLAFYSILLIPRIVLNVFDFGQAIHFYAYMDKLDEEADKKKKDSQE